MKRDQWKGPGSNGKKDRPRAEWKDLVILKGDLKGRQRACVKITHAWIRGETCHSFCFGLEGRDGFRPMMHIPEVWVREHIKLMREADMLSSVLHLVGKDGDAEFAAKVLEFAKSDKSLPETPEAKSAQNVREKIAKPNGDGQKVKEKRFATFADALKAKGQNLPASQ